MPWWSAVPPRYNNYTHPTPLLSTHPQRSTLDTRYSNLITILDLPLYLTLTFTYPIP